MATPRANQLLATLPADDFDRLSHHLTPRAIKPRQVLQKRDEPLTEVYFPARSLSSLTINTANGMSAEVAVVGPEGLIGIEAVMGRPHAMCDAIVQATGDGVAYAMSIDVFRRELERGGALHGAATRFAQACIGFITQLVACNALHSAEARSCRWLLHAQDRLVTDEFPLTHELLSELLGVRRPTITLIMSELVRLGAVRTVRGGIKITNRDALGSRACECYRIVKNTYDTLLIPDTSEAQAG